MHNQNQITESVFGRTYSLYGTSESSLHFYELIQQLLNDCLAVQPNEAELLKTIQNASKKPFSLLKIKKKNPELSKVISNLRVSLAAYITDLEEHLSSLSLKKRLDKVLSTNEYQYYLYMIEIALVNRIYKDEFIKCERKIALLPHCLRDLSRKCMSEPSGMDYICKACSKNCYVNSASKILKDFDIEPYIWLTASQRKLFKKETENRTSLGVLGIACIPELVQGMRMCIKKNLPVVGIPLDANRCARWMGEFHPNTVNLQKLRELIS